jgi:hypothetical protein
MVFDGLSDQTDFPQIQGGPQISFFCQRTLLK